MVCVCSPTCTISLRPRPLTPFLVQHTPSILLHGACCVVQYEGTAVNRLDEALELLWATDDLDYLYVDGWLFSKRRSGGVGGLLNEVG